MKILDSALRHGYLAEEIENAIEIFRDFENGGVVFHCNKLSKEIAKYLETVR